MDEDLEKQISFYNMNRSQLLQVARQMGHKGYSKLNMDKLCSLLINTKHECVIVPLSSTSCIVCNLEHKCKITHELNYKCSICNKDHKCSIKRPIGSKWYICVICNKRPHSVCYHYDKNKPKRNQHLNLYMINNKITDYHCYKCHETDCDICAWNKIVVKV